MLPPLASSMPHTWALWHSTCPLTPEDPPSLGHQAELAQQSALARAVAQLRTLIEPGLRPWLVNTAEQAQKAADFAYRCAHLLEAKGDDAE